MKYSCFPVTINGTDTAVVNTPDRTTLEVVDASDFPDSGKFFFVPKNEIQTFFPVEGDTTIFQYNSKLSSCLPTYTYASKSGNTLQGISPQLPVLAGIGQVNLVTANRNDSNIITCTTATAHDYQVGDTAVIDGTTITPNTGIGTSGNETFFADFNTDLNAVRSNGAAAPVDQDGTPTVSSGELVLDDTVGVPATYKAVYYDAADNLDVSQNFQIETVISFNYSGAPSIPVNTLLAIGQRNGPLENVIRLIHRQLGVDGGFQLLAYDENGVLVQNTVLTFNPVAGQKYRLTITGDPSTGMKFFVDGSSAGQTTTTSTPFVMDNSLVDSIG